MENINLFSPWQVGADAKLLGLYFGCSVVVFAVAADAGRSASGVATSPLSALQSQHSISVRTSNAAHFFDYFLIAQYTITHIWQNAPIIGSIQSRIQQMPIKRPDDSMAKSCRRPHRKETFSQPQVIRWHLFLSS